MAIKKRQSQTPSTPGRCRKCGKRGRQHRWRCEVADEILTIHHPVDLHERAESLCPTATTILNAILGVAEAVAIIDSYAFRFPVTLEVPR